MAAKRNKPSVSEAKSDSGANSLQQFLPAVRQWFTSVIGNGKEEDTWFWKTQQVNRQAESDMRESGLEWVVARNGLYLEKDLTHIVHPTIHGRQEFRDASFLIFLHRPKTPSVGLRRMNT